MKNILVPIDPTRPDRTRSAIAQVVQLGREEPVTARQFLLWNIEYVLFPVCA